jgi:group I intron endonuclease
MSERHIIYGLLDPITKIIHYVGYSSNKKKRLYDHCYHKNGTKEKRIWISRLKKQGLQPIMEVIQEYLTAEELPEAERFWFEYFKLVGAELYNDPHYVGGGSMKGRTHTEETKLKLRIKRIGKTPMKGRAHTKESKQKISHSNKGRTSPNKGKSPTNEVRLKISNSLKGKPSTRNGKTWKMIEGKIIWFNKPNAPEGQQQCNKCAKIKLLEEFYFTNATHTKRKGMCKICCKSHSQ